MNSQRNRDPVSQRRVAEHYLHAAGDSGRLHRTVSLAARVMNFPLGQVNILDDQQQYTIGGYRTGLTVTPREDSMCQFVVDDDVPVLAVDDLRAEDRYRRLPGVQQGHARSYLGVPLPSREATSVGTLCLVDDRPRHITDSEILRITEFGDIVADQLDLMRRNSEASVSWRMSAMIGQALADEQIVPWYQPVVDLASGRRVGFEALARWRRADGSVQSPSAFLSAVEDSDLIIDLDRAVITTALADLVRWRRQDPSLRMNVNLSTRHLELPDGADFMIEVARTVGVDPSAVTVEITETRDLSDIGRASAVVRALQSAGFQVVLDDFGNGWSRLDWLFGLGADGMKADRAVSIALGTPVGDAVSRAIAGMASELGMSTTIEGIDDIERLEAARRHGFQLAQGFHWSPPVPAGVVDATL